MFIHANLVSNEGWSPFNAQHFHALDRIPRRRWRERRSSFRLPSALARADQKECIP